MSENLSHVKLGLPRKPSERFPCRLDPLIFQREEGWERGNHPKTQI